MDARLATENVNISIKIRFVIQQNLTLAELFFSKTLPAKPRMSSAHL